jgi:hypothetical protein
MNRGLWALLLALFAPPAVHPQELARDFLDKLKSATCFVVVDTPAGRGSGSGFLFLKRGTTGYLITCAHVTRGAEKVQIVFGSGTTAERTLEGRVIGADSDRDLACVVLKDAKDLPGTLDILTKTAVAETENVYVAGFPFGRMLAAGAKNPEISISKVSVSSVRRDTDNRIVAVQMSGDVNPGNSGGPVVDSKGKVVGVAQSKVSGSSTAFAVPTEEIQGFLKGRVGTCSFKPTASTATDAKFEARVGLIDPLTTLKGVGLAWCPEKLFTENPPQKNKDGTWGKIHPSVKTQALKIEEDVATGILDVPRAPGDPDQHLILVQVSFVTADGKTLWTEPLPLQVDFAEAAAPAAKADPKGGPAPGPAPAPGAKAVDIPVGDDLKIVGSLRLRAAVADLLLAPDGSALYALDLSEGKVWQLKPDTLEVVAQVDVIDNAISMCLTPNGQTLYVGGREPNLQKPGGHIQVISAGGLKTTSTFAVPFAVHQIAATNAGTVVATGFGQWTGVTLIDPSKKSVSATIPNIYGGSTVRLHPDRLRVYTGEVGISPSNHLCVSLRKDAKGVYENYRSPYHGDHPLGGTFEISPDGRFLVGQFGSVLRLGRTREADMQFVTKIDPGISIAMAKGSNTFIVANPEGFLKVYDLQTFDLKKSVRIGKLLSKVALDGVKGRLYAVAGPLPPTQGGFFDPRAMVAGDIISISLTGK